MKGQLKVKEREKKPKIKIENGATEKDGIKGKVDGKVKERKARKPKHQHSPTKSDPTPVVTGLDPVVFNRVCRSYDS